MICFHCRIRAPDFGLDGDGRRICRGCEIRRRLSRPGFFARMAELRDEVEREALEDAGVLAEDSGWRALNVEEPEERRRALMTTTYQREAKRA